eukprot:44159_1
MADLYNELNKWDGTKLGGILNVNLSIYNQNKQFLQILKKTAKSSIKTIVFKSIIKAEEEQIISKSSRKNIFSSKLVNTKDETGKYSFQKLQDDYVLSEKIIEQIRNDLLTKKMTVETTEKYLATLSSHSTNEIAEELRLLMQADDFKSEDNYIQQTASSIKSLFVNIKKIKNYKLLYDATHIFKAMFLIYKDISQNQKNPLTINNWELIDDKQYAETEFLANKDVSSCTIIEISQLQSKHQTYLIDLKHPAIDYLVLLKKNESIMVDLFDKFNDNKQFHDRMTLFVTDSAVEKQRSICLTKVRNTIVNFVKRIVKTMESNKLTMSELHNELSVSIKEIRTDDVEAMKVVASSWNGMLTHIIDPASKQYSTNLQLLQQIDFFQFEREDQQDKMHDDDTSNYVSISVKQKTQTNVTTDNAAALTQNEFLSLLDSISIFISGSDMIPPDLPQKQLSSYSTQQIIQLIKKKDLIYSEINTPHKIFEKIENESVDGQKLTRNVNVDAIRYLLFPNILQKEQPSVVKKTATEMVKMIRLILLQSQIQTEYIPKFDQIQDIAICRLKYYFEGGRDSIIEANEECKLNDRRIPIETSLENLKLMATKWRAKLKKWQTNMMHLREKHAVLTCFSVTDMLYLLEKIKKYVECDETKETEKQYLIMILSAKISFIDPTISMEEVEQMTNHCNKIPNNINELGALLNDIFGARLYNNISMSIGKPMVLLSKRPNLFYCKKESLILQRVIKLFLSQGLRPVANRILFCD